MGPIALYGVFNFSTVEHVADEHGDIQRAREQRDHRILELYAAGCSQRAIAEKVGCALGLVNSVIKRLC